MRKLGMMIATAAAALLPLSVSSAAADTTLRMWTFLDPSGTTGREIVLRKLLDSFEAANPGVQVEVEKQVWTTLTTKYIAAHQAGNAPDVVWAHNDLVGTAIEAGSLANLRDYFVGRWTPEQIADIDDTYWRHASRSDANHCITQSRAYFGVAYRKDLLRDAGLDPKSIQTWDDLVAAAQKLTMKNPDGTVKVWGFGQAFGTDSPNPQLMFNYMLAEQGSIVGQDGKAMFATPAGIEGLRLQTDMVRKYGVSPDYIVTLPHDDLWDQFAAGRFAIVQAGSTRIPTVQAALGAENVGYMLWPSRKAGTPSPSAVTGWCIGLWSGGESKELAASLVDHLTNHAADVLWVREAGQAPVWKSTITKLDDFFAAPENAYLVEVARGMASAGWTPPADLSIDGYREDLNLAAQDVLVNGMMEEEALRKAEERFNQRHRR